MNDPAHTTPSAGNKWEEIEAKPAFRELLQAKSRFLHRATIFFVVYYFALLVLVGWFPGLMKTQVLGKVNLAYLFALSQFFMAWSMAYIYVRKAAAWDRAAEEILKP